MGDPSLIEVGVVSILISNGNEETGLHRVIFLQMTHSDQVVIEQQMALNHIQVSLHDIIHIGRIERSYDALLCQIYLGIAHGSNGRWQVGYDGNLASCGNDIFLYILLDELLVLGSSLYIKVIAIIARAWSGCGNEVKNKLHLLPSQRLGPLHNLLETFFVGRVVLQYILLYRFRV